MICGVYSWILPHVIGIDWQATGKGWPIKDGSHPVLRKLLNQRGVYLMSQQLGLFRDTWNLLGGLNIYDVLRAVSKLWSQY